MFTYFIRFMHWLGFTTLSDAEVERFTLITRLKKLAPIIASTVRELDENVRADGLLLNAADAQDQLQSAVDILETHRLRQAAALRLYVRSKGGSVSEGNRRLTDCHDEIDLALLDAEIDAAVESATTLPLKSHMRAATAD